MAISQSRRSAVVAGVVAALAIALAPTAHAGSNDVSCHQRGGAKVCQKQGHASLHTAPKVRPNPNGLMGSAWLPGYGKGHLPPLIALD